MTLLHTTKKGVTENSEVRHISNTVIVGQETAWIKIIIYRKISISLQRGQLLQILDMLTSKWGTNHGLMGRLAAWIFDFNVHWWSVTGVTGKASVVMDSTQHIANTLILEARWGLYILLWKVHVVVICQAE